MNISKFSKLSLIIVSCVLLAACSTTKSPSSAEVGSESEVVASAAMQSGAEAQGMGESNAFQDQEAANKLKAPYDQVYHFAFDSDQVLSDDMESLQVQANYLFAHPKAHIRLEGNADERGSREYNVALGWRRAKAVATVLKQHGVSDKQMSLVSYGMEKPLAFGHDEHAYSLNRRVNLVYEVK